MDKCVKFLCIVEQIYIIFIIVVMKRYVLFLILLLNGCFMYDNFKHGIACSFDDSKCDGYEERQKLLNGMNDKAEEMIENRCTQVHNTPKGTMQYMHCQERVGAMYRIDRESMDIDEAFRELRNSLAKQEMTCEDYGIKPGTKNFSDCTRELEEKYVLFRAGQYENEAKRFHERMNRRVNCTTENILGKVYTRCE